MRIKPHYLLLSGGILLLMTGLLSRKKKYNIILDKTSEKNIAELLPQVQAKVRELAFRADSYGIKIVITDGYRTIAEQQASKESGKSATALGWHQTKRAVDYVVIDPKTGKKNYKANDPSMKPLYDKVIEIAQSLGFTALGFKVIKIKSGASAGKTFQDPYHIQYEEGLTKAQALKQVGVA